MKLDLNLISVFLEVYQYQSYTLAAEALGMTQPGVSAAVKRLENEVQGQLFIRQGRKMQPTAIAVRLSGRFQNGISEIQNALTERFTYSVYISEALGFNLPNMENILIEQTPIEQDILINNLRNHSVDFAIGLFAEKDSSLNYELVLKEDTVVVCSKDHPRIKGSISREQFYCESHVKLALNWNGLDAFEYICIESVQERKIAHKIGSLAGLLMQVSCSDNLGLVSRSLAEQWKAPLNLQILENPIECRDLEYMLTYHRRYQKNAAHKEKREFLIKCLLEKNKALHKL